ncbi:MAG: hypothetical protein KM310_00085 [Clostridiales bacterium]|nr:hypothetical protein [Clostridiales bacterium]
MFGFFRPKTPQPGGAEDWVNWDAANRDYIDLEPEDTETSEPFRFHAPMRRRFPLRVWLFIAGTLLFFSIVFFVGYLSTPRVFGEPVIATPTFRQIAQDVNLLRSFTQATHAWDAFLNPVLLQDAPPAAAAYEHVQEYLWIGDQADALRKRLTLITFHGPSVLYAQTLIRWIEQYESLYGRVSNWLLSPVPDANEFPGLREDWLYLLSTRDTMEQNLWKLAQEYPLIRIIPGFSPADEP